MTIIVRESIDLTSRRIIVISRIKSVSELTTVEPIIILLEPNLPNTLCANPIRGALRFFIWYQYFIIIINSY